MPSKRTPVSRQQKHKITPRAIEVYRHARQLYDDEAGLWDTMLDVFEALRVTEFGDLRRELNALLGRSEPWLPDLFECIDEDAPPSWMKDEWHRKHWLDARKILTALEQEAA